VHRKYASKGVMDLVCIMKCNHGLGYETASHVDYVQCKTNGKIGHQEAVELINHSLKHGARPVLAYKDAKKHIVIEVLS